MTGGRAAPMRRSFDEGASRPLGRGLNRPKRGGMNSTSLPACREHAATQPPRPRKILSEAVDVAQPQSIQRSRRRTAKCRHPTPHDRMRCMAAAQLRACVAEYSSSVGEDFAARGRVSEFAERQRPVRKLPAFPATLRMQACERAHRSFGLVQLFHASAALDSRNECASARESPRRRDLGANRGARPGRRDIPQSWPFIRHSSDRYQPSPNRRVRRAWSAISSPAPPP